MSIIEGIGVLVMSAGIAAAVSAWFHRIPEIARAHRDMPTCRDYLSFVWALRVAGPIVAIVGLTMMALGGAA